MGSVLTRLLDSLENLTISSGIPEDPDLTVQLPDELLCQVLSNVKSFPDRFKSAAVNRKFRRCMLTELNKPIPLKLSSGTRYRRLNGHKMTNDKFLDRVRILARVAQFSSISVGKWPKHMSDHLHKTFDILCQTQCLRQVKKFEQSENSCMTPVLRRTLTICEKVAVVKIGFRVGPDFLPHFIAAMKDKSLTELVLNVEHLHEPQLTTELFETLQPTTLKKVVLSFSGISPLTMLSTINKLGSSAAWASLSRLQLGFALDYQMEPMAAFLNGLEAFHFGLHCHFRLKTESLDAEFGAVVVSLLSNNRCSRHLSYEIVAAGTVPACRVVEFVGQVQAAHPNVEVYLGSEWFCWLEFSLDNVSLAAHVYSSHCADESCARCLSFYQNVIYALASQVGNEESEHLAHYRLDRCKVERVVDDLNELARLRGTEWRAVDAAANDGQTEATITIQAENGQELATTVALDRCFNNTCPRCLMIE